MGGFFEWVSYPSLPKYDRLSPFMPPRIFARSPRRYSLHSNCLPHISLSCTNIATISLLDQQKTAAKLLHCGTDKTLASANSSNFCNSLFCFPIYVNQCRLKAPCFAVAIHATISITTVILSYHSPPSYSQYYTTKLLKFSRNTPKPPYRSQYKPLDGFFIGR